MQQTENPNWSHRQKADFEALMQVATELINRDHAFTHVGVVTKDGELGIVWNPGMPESAMVKNISLLKKLVVANYGTFWQRLLNFNAPKFITTHAPIN